VAGPVYHRLPHINNLILFCLFKNKKAMHDILIQNPKKFIDNYDHKS